MRRIPYAVISACMLLAGAAQAAELKVISSDGLSQVLDALKPKYEQATGNTLSIRYEVANVIRKDILESGVAFDVLLSTNEAVDEIVQGGKAAAESRVAIARSGLGIAYKAGTPRPDIHDGPSFKEAVEKAASVAYLPAGSTGKYFKKLAEENGFLAQLDAKAIVLDSSSRAATSSAGAAQLNTVLQAVLDGRAALGIQSISNIIAAEGIEYVPFPPELQRYRSYSGVIGSASGQADAVAGLLKFLADPANAELIKSKHMEPGA